MLKNVQICKDCFNCKQKNNKVYCKLGFFGPTNADEFNNVVWPNTIYYPEYFECKEFRSMN